ncbi:MAG: Mur ligase family protein [Treponema sp.]|nr:Mur ligase family protein [Treponema sp.]
MSNCFSTSNEVFNWLSSFINLERGQKPKSFRIDRMEALAELSGHPEKCAPSIHIAGSKGKGSVTSMLTGMLTSAGFKVARYMSPHVIDIRERICFGDSYFNEEIYCAAGDELRRVTEELLPAAVKSQPSTAALFDAALPDGCEPTFWELITLLFFLCAREAKCDVMVVETGMGGRLDSTNILDPVVSVITLIELEHTSFLGNTIEAVAGEKAGIIKQGKPVIVARQTDKTSKQVLEVFQKTSDEKDSPLYYLPDVIKLANVNITKQNTEFNLSVFRDPSPPPCEILGLSVPLPGKVQAENAALAAFALNIFMERVVRRERTSAQRTRRSDWVEAVRAGLKDIKIPARFEKIFEKPAFIIDGAHTQESFDLCVETFCSLYGGGANGINSNGVLIFGCAADKDAAAMARIAHPHFAKIFITTPGNFKVSDPDKVYEAFTEITGKEKTLLVKDTQEAVRQAMLFANTSHENQTKGSHKSRGKAEEVMLPILAAGSFYLVSEIRKLFYHSFDEVPDE